MDIAQEFRDEMELVHEENPTLGFKDQLRLAADRLTESVGRIVERERDRYYWSHQEAVNKTHFG